MKAWRIVGRHIAAPPADWRQQLVDRLGERPRRLGAWAELALFGALRCLDVAGEAALPRAALLSLATLHGPDQALRAALADSRDGPPLPIAFLNSQPNQVLPALARHLGWQGNGRCLATRDPAAALWLAGAEAGEAGLLIGWVEEGTPGRSTWLRLVSAEGTVALRQGRFDDPAVSHVAADSAHFFVGP